MIVIDGNIGSGKTTQLGLLEKKGYRVRREPLEQWPLKEFYENPSRWAFFFHMVLLKTQKPPNIPVIYERSLYSSRFVFWSVLHKQGVVTDKETETYDYFFRKFSWKPALFIYLSKTPELAFQHIQTRGQDGDAGVTLQYLQDLDKEYQNLIKHMPCKVIIVNANKPADEIHTEICQHLVDNDNLFRTHLGGEEMQETSNPRRKVQCTPFQHMCSVS
jgi:deoxyadenosine/deoxycytidine kinase